MNIQFLSVQRCGPAANSRPRIQLTGGWLAEMGFVDGALVEALPVPGGIDFILRNENIRRYSGLYHCAKENGGSLIRAYVPASRSRKGPAFVASGRYILKGGLKVGDQLAAKYEYGLVRVRKAGDGIRLLQVTKERDGRTGAFRPKAWLWGSWLNDIGFAPGAIVAIAAEPGCITLTAQGGDAKYGDIVKSARQNRARLVKAIARRGVPTINFTGPPLVRAGFAIGDALAAECGRGLIKLQRLELGRFGF
jgi:hypothetical protein